MVRVGLTLAALALFSIPSFGQIVNPGGGGGGGATIPSTTSILKGDGTGNAAVATPSDISSAARIPGIDTSTCVYQALLTEGTGAFADTCGGQAAITPNAPWVGKFLNFTKLASQSTPLPAVVGTARTLTFGLLYPPATGVPFGDYTGYGDSTSFGLNKTFFCGTLATNMCILDNFSPTGGSTNVGSHFQYYRPTANTQAVSPIMLGWHVFTILCGNASDSTYDTLYLDGKILPMTATNIRNCSATGQYYLGGGASTNVNGPWSGQIGFFQADLGRDSDATTISKQAAVKQFLISKGAHFDYITQGGTDSRLATLGDSRTFGISGTALATALATIGALPGIPTSNFYNVGVSGLRSWDMYSAFPIYTGYYLNGQSSCIATVWIGVNSSSSGWSSSEETPIKKAVDAIHERHCLAVVLEEIDAYGTAGTAQQTFLHAETAAIRAHSYSQWGADNVVALGSTQMAVTGYSQTGTSANFNADMLHPTSNGMTNLIAPYVWNVAAETLGSTSLNPTIYTATTALAAVDGYAVLGSAAAGAATFTEQSCLGYSRGRVRMNRSAFTLTIAAASGETINGSASINVPANTSVKITPVPNAPGTLGCSFTTTAP